MKFIDLLTALLSFIASARKLLFVAGGGSSPADKRECDANDPYAIHACIPGQQKQRQPKKEGEWWRMQAHPPGMRGNSFNVDDYVAGAGRQYEPRTQMQSSRVRKVLNNNEKSPISSPGDKLTSRELTTAALSTTTAEALSTKTVESEEPEYLKIGSLVELYWTSSRFAIPAVVWGKTIGKYEIKYNLGNAITNAVHIGVAEELIHPYQVYEEGTKAYCNVGAVRTIKLVPCTILDHSIKRTSGFVSYQVSNDRWDDGGDYMWLPFSRVQRVRTLASEEVELEAAKEGGGGGNLFDENKKKL